MILVADVGGTNSRFALATARGIEEVHTYPSMSAPGIEPLLASYLARTRARPATLSLAVAGPVAGGVCTATNLPWIVDAGRIEAHLHTLGLAASVAVINDFEAIAWGVREVPAAMLSTLQVGEPERDGPLAILGAGTGLGEALAVPGPAGELRVIPTEGGHADLAPRNADEDALLAFLRTRFPDHVSYERVLSGPGLATLFEHLAPAGDEREAVLSATDPAREVIARQQDSAVCRRAAELFVDLLGAEAGNLALKSLPTGGLYLAGGMAPRLRELVESRLLDAFLAKGRMRRVLARIPVRLVLDGHVGLRGAAARVVATGRGPLE